MTFTQNELCTLRAALMNHAVRLWRENPTRAAGNAADGLSELVRASFDVAEMAGREHGLITFLPEQLSLAVAALTDRASSTTDWPKLAQDTHALLARLQERQMLVAVGELKRMGIDASYEHPGYIAANGWAFGIEDGQLLGNTEDGTTAADGLRQDCSIAAAICDFLARPAILDNFCDDCGQQVDDDGNCHHCASFIKGVLGDQKT